MRIVVDVNHPAHIHFFRNFISEMNKRGHKVLITASRSDIISTLLDSYGLDYTIIEGYGGSLVEKCINVFLNDLKMYNAIKSFNPSILLGLGSVRAAHVSRLLGRPCIVFEDSEHTRLQNWLYRPFAKCIYSSHTFSESYGRKHIKYNGFDEIAYLHPAYFTPDPEVLEKLNLKKDQFILLRFSSWAASHDIGKSGFAFGSDEELHKFLKSLEECNFQVLVSAEGNLPDSLKQYNISISPEEMHDLLYFARIYIGEGATMAAEAAVLGTPSIYVSSISLGYINELRDKYGLIHTCHGYTEANEIALSLLANPDLKVEWHEKRARLLNESIDITKFIVETVENYQFDIK